jgi:two-component system, LuxR family, response regulator FixJ
MTRERIIHIVDDDSAVRRSLERLVHSAGFSTKSYGTADAFVAAAPSSSDGCILLDVWMPGWNGIELLAHLRRMGVALPVIVITGHGDVQTAVLAMKNGAADFIEKPFSDEALLCAIEAALASGRADRDVEVEDAARHIARLSRREREVLDALVEGKPNKIIAYDLGLSVRTVEVHRARMMERLGVRQFAEAVRLAVLAQMLRPP